MYLISKDCRVFYVIFNFKQSNNFSREIHYSSAGIFFFVNNKILFYCLLSFLLLTNNKSMSMIIVQI